MPLEVKLRFGWLHVFRGFVSLLDWADFYYREDQTPLDIRRADMDKILAQVVRVLQDYMLAVRKSRNAVLHDAINSVGSNIVHSSINQAITQLYSVRSTLSRVPYYKAISPCL